MNKIRLIAGAIALAVVTMICTTPQVEAQQRGQGPGQGGGPGGRGNFDPEQFRQRMEERMRERYEFSEAEWKVVGPRFTAVQELQRGGRGFPGFGGRGGFGGGRGGRGDRDQEDTSARGALNKAIEDGASAEVIKEKIAAYRAEQAANEAKLKKAQDELRQLLTLKQEAMAILDGMLP